MGVTVKAPGSCGELVQGTLNGDNFLITCPVDIYSHVEVELGVQGSNAGVKTVLAVEKTLKYFECRQNFKVSVASKLPCGKGMASSSADISAACQAAALSIGKQLTPLQIAEIALSIEPTDAIFFPGIVMFDHVSGKVCRMLGKPPAIKIAVFDAGGEVDTLNFNKRSDLIDLNRAKEAIIRQAVDFVTEGLIKGSAELIGRGTTLSALANQSILYKPDIEILIDLIKAYKAVGINVAHSGTVIGVLFDAADLSGHDDCILKIKETCPQMTYIGTCSLISGGLKIL